MIKNTYFFSVPVRKEVKRIYKIGKEVTETISYKSKFIDSAIFTASSLSNLVNNLTDGINCNVNMIKCKYGHDNKFCETCGITYKNWQWVLLEYTNVVLHSVILHYALHTKLHVVLYSIVVKRCLPILIYGWLEKTQRNVVTWKLGFLQESEYGKCYWSRLHACKKSSQRF